MPVKRRPLGPAPRTSRSEPTRRPERCSRLSGRRPSCRISAGMGPRRSGLFRDTGAALVRGRQLDGDSGLGFDRGPTWSNRVHNALRLEGPESGLHPALNRDNRQPATLEVCRGETRPRTDRRFPSVTREEGHASRAVRVTSPTLAQASDGVRGCGFRASAVGNEGRAQAGRSRPYLRSRRQRPRH